MTVISTNVTRSSLWGEKRELRKSVLLCLIMAAVILAMENILIRIPVQRVSIHNIYADKSYTHPLSTRLV